MPKYTSPKTYSAGETITSSDWNDYFGSGGNLQWAYDEYRNIAAVNGVTLLNSAYLTPNKSAMEMHRFVSYSSARGATDNASTSTGVILSPLYKGYVWVTATVEHEVTSGASTNTPSFYICIVPVNSSLETFDNTNQFMYKIGVSTNNAQGASIITSWGLWPIVRTATISTIIQVTDGFEKFQVAMYRTDASALNTQNWRCKEFTLLPLGDVSGLVNVLERMTVIE
jgi:hypothetical protein